MIYSRRADILELWLVHGGLEVSACDRCIMTIMIRTRSSGGSLIKRLNLSLRSSQRRYSRGLSHTHVMLSFLWPRMWRYACAFMIARNPRLGMIGSVTDTIVQTYYVNAGLGQQVFSTLDGVFCLAHALLKCHEKMYKASSDIGAQAPNMCKYSSYYTIGI